MKYLLGILILFISINNVPLLAANFDGVTPASSTATVSTAPTSAPTSKLKVKRTQRRHVHHTDKVHTGRNRLRFEDTWLGWILYFAIPSSLLALGILLPVTWLWILGASVLLYCTILFVWFLITALPKTASAEGTKLLSKKHRKQFAHQTANITQNVSLHNSKLRFWGWVFLILGILGGLIAAGLIFNILWLTILGLALGLVTLETIMFLVLILITSWTGVK